MTEPSYEYDPPNLFYVLIAKEFNLNKNGF